jgi:hypothetical protein
MDATCYAGGGIEGGPLVEVGTAYPSQDCTDCYPTKWHFFGTERGSQVSWPARLWGFDKEGQCGVDFDPRLRPWYTAGAAGPKDVILVIDTSGSMTDLGRMENAKAAAKSVIDGLTSSDFISVAPRNTPSTSSPCYLARPRWWFSRVGTGGDLLHRGGIYQRSPGPRCVQLPPQN